MMIYLDNAATSYPKPDVFYTGATQVLSHPYGNPNRGGHAGSVNSEQLVSRVKQKLATLINAESHEHIATCYNTSDALNLVINGLCKRFKPEHIVTSIFEHNSVLRPLYHLKNTHKFSLHILKPNRNNWKLDVESTLKGLGNQSNKPILIILSHVANSVGTVQDIANFGKICRRYNAYLVIDGAQSIGHIALNVLKSSVDVLVFPGHKGLLGPTGLGFIYLNERVKQSNILCQRQGGDGVDSQSVLPSLAFPQSFEVGTSNIHGLALLELSLDWLNDNSYQPALRALSQYLYQRLASISQLTIYSPMLDESNVGILLCNLGTLDSNVVASILDSEYGISVRAGIHCAPLAHQWLGTIESNQGALRISLGPFNTKNEIDKLYMALAELASYS